MKFISENPAEKYAIVGYEGRNIYLDENDISSETLENAKSFCTKHGCFLSTSKVRNIYYLRGHLQQANYSQVVKGIFYGDNLPAELFEIIHCLSFWNQEGEKCYAMNKTGAESYADFILKCMASDCSVFVTPYPDQFITGKGGNHVWVDNRQTNERILIIHF